MKKKFLFFIILHCSFFSTELKKVPKFLMYCSSGVPLIYCCFPFLDIASSLFLLTVVPPFLKCSMLLLMLFPSTLDIVPWYCWLLFPSIFLILFLDTVDCCSPLYSWYCSLILLTALPLYILDIVPWYCWLLFPSILDIVPWYCWLLFSSILDIVP